MIRHASNKYLISFFALALLLLAGLAQAGGSLKIINLQYRSAQSVIPIIKPLLNPGDAISGSANTLIIRTSPANLQQIAQVIHALDVPAKNLMISVKLSNSYSNNHQVIIAETGGANSNANDMQNIRVLNGHKAHITFGKEIPFMQVESSYGNTVAGTNYRPMISGFYVIPNLVGNNSVKLQIYQQFQQTGNRDYGSIQSQDVGSTITIPLDQWVPLAGGGAGASQIRHEIVTATTKTSSVYIKVSKIR